MATSSVERFAGFAARLRYDQLPGDVIADTKRLLLDSLGCALAGVRSDKGRWALDYARGFHAGSDQATAVGFGERLSVPGAAFVNGELANALDYDAGGKPGHTPPFVLPAALATAERNRASGRELIVACALALEMTARIGGAMSSIRDIKGDKVPFPPVAGYSSSVFGGTAAVARLEGLAEDRIAHAIGMAGHLAPMQTQAAWINNLPATSAKYLMAGWMNETLIAAAALVKAGHRGNLGVLDGDTGFWRFAGSAKWDADAALAGLGDEWRFPAETTYKQFPICRIMHGALDGLTALLEREAIAPDEIERVHAWLEASCVQPVFANRAIDVQVDAQFSIPYGLAMVALGIAPGPRWQDPEVMHAEATRRMMDRTAFDPHPGYVEALRANPRARISRVEVRARGRAYAEERLFIRGTTTDDPATQLSDAELLDKFARNAREALPAAKAADAATRLMALEEAANVADVVALLVP